VEVIFLFAIDIDGTIAWPDKALARFHNEDLQLGIPEQMLERITSYEQFIHTAELTRFLEQQLFPGKMLENSRKRARRNPEYLASLDAIPGAVQALRGLAKQDRINYYTARDASVEQATRTWLAQKQFPHMPVVYCCSARNKLVKLYEREQGSSELIMLIDDHWLQLLEAYHGLTQGRYKQVIGEWREVAQFVKERVMIVGFGATAAEVNFTPTLPVKALAGWEHMNDFMALFQATLQ